MWSVCSRYVVSVWLMVCSVLARPKRQGAAPCHFVRRPAVFPQRPFVFSAACHFPRALWFLRAFISVILAKGGAIFVHHVVIRVGMRVRLR